MTRTIEMDIEFEGADCERYSISFTDDGVRIRDGFDNILIKFADFDRIVSERENFKKLNASLEAA